MAMNFPRRQALRLFSFAFGSSVLLGREALGSSQASAGQKAPAPTSTPASAPAPDKDREKVLGIGGFFFRSKDPAALGKWYEQHLGITLSPTSMDSPVWTQQAGQTLFTPFPETTHYFGDASKQWMMNFRVRDLARLTAQLTAYGIEVKPSAEDPKHFARIHDPEGNPIELWQPMA
jgi:predicted enzyme related to lactoylglutathione lyase